MARPLRRAFIVKARTCSAEDLQDNDFTEGSFIIRDDQYWANAAYD